jgi:hypothetical protein
MVLFIYFIGKAWSILLPRGDRMAARWRERNPDKKRLPVYITLAKFINPHSFGLKEHAIASITASSASQGSLSVVTFTVQRLFYEGNPLSAVTVILGILSISLFGYGLTGLLRPVTVWGMSIHILLRRVQTDVQHPRPCTGPTSHSSLHSKVFIGKTFDRPSDFGTFGILSAGWRYIRFFRRISCPGSTRSRSLVWLRRRLLGVLHRYLLICSAAACRMKDWGSCLSRKSSSTLIISNNRMLMTQVRLAVHHFGLYLPASRLPCMSPFCELSSMTDPFS